MIRAGVDDSEEARRVRFSEKHPEVHFTNPLSDPDGLHGAVWERDGIRHEIRKADLKVLLDELEAVFKC